MPIIYVIILRDRTYVHLHVHDLLIVRGWGERGESFAGISHIFIQSHTPPWHSSFIWYVHSTGEISPESSAIPGILFDVARLEFLLPCPCHTLDDNEYLFFFKSPCNTAALIGVDIIIISVLVLNTVNIHIMITRSYHFIFHVCQPLNMIPRI